MNAHEKAFDLLTGARAQSRLANTATQAKLIEKTIQALAADLVALRPAVYDKTATDLVPVLLSREQAQVMREDLSENGKKTTVSAWGELDRALGDRDQSAGGVS